MTALTDAGIDPDATTITEKLQGVSLRSALRLLLRQPGLTYLIKDEVRLVTTKDKGQESLRGVIYPLTMHVDPLELVNLIQSAVPAPTWDIFGGPGSIGAFTETNSLVISQNGEAYEEITELLPRWRVGPPLPGTKADPTASPRRFTTVREGRLLQELAHKLVPLCNTALGENGAQDSLNGENGIHSGRRLSRTRRSDSAMQGCPGTSLPGVADHDYDPPAE